MNSIKKTSLQDIADELCISKGTVSLVLSGKAKSGRVSESMCKKVREAALKMNYQPNEIARSLSTGKTMTIGAVVADISNSFFGGLTFYMQEHAKTYGYTVITVNTNENLDDFKSIVDALLNRQIDGIIMVPVFNGQDVVRKIINRHVPLVLIDRCYPEINVNHVIVDNYKVSAGMVESLIQKGCRRIAVVCYDINLDVLAERCRGCTDMLKQYGLFDPVLVKKIAYDNTEAEVRQAIIDLKNYSHKVDAIFFCSCRVFIFGVKYMRKEKIRIPMDMEVVCFDKMESFSIASIPIHFIEQPIKEISEKAVDILMQQINGLTDIQKYKLEAKIELANDYLEDK